MDLETAEKKLLEVYDAAMKQEPPELMAALQALSFMPKEKEPE